MIPSWYQYLTNSLKFVKGSIILVLKNTAIVEGINIATWHVKSGTGAKETGFVQKELPINISNLVFKDSESKAKP